MNDENPKIYEGRKHQFGNGGGINEVVEAIEEVRPLFEDPTTENLLTAEKKLHDAARTMELLRGLLHESLREEEEEEEEQDEPLLAD